MKKFLIFISFIFIFLSCCLTSFESKGFQRPVIGIQQMKSVESSTVKENDSVTDCFIVGSAQLNLLQYLSNLFENGFAVLANNTYKNLNLYLVFNHWEFLSFNNLKVSCLLNPRAP